MTTMAMMDWAMQALGISMVPARRGEAPACAVGLDGRSVDADVIVFEPVTANGVIRFDRDVPNLQAGCRSVVVESGTIVNDVAAVDRLAIDGSSSRLSVIHTVHGIMETGDWFLLADLGEAVACREPPAGTIITTSARDG